MEIKIYPTVTSSTSSTLPAESFVQLRAKVSKLGAVMEMADCMTRKGRAVARAQEIWPELGPCNDSAMEY